MLHCTTIVQPKLFVMTSEVHHHMKAHTQLKLRVFK